MQTATRRALAALRKHRADYGDGWSARKRTWIRELDRARALDANALERFHEALLFLAAYPDDAPLWASVERALKRFPSRADLRRRRDELVNTGIAGTDIEYPFFPATAAWLAERFGRRLTVLWEDFEAQKSLVDRLALFALWTETPALDELELSARAWVARMKSPRESDAQFLMRRIAALPGDEFTRERFHEELDFPMRLAWGAGGPSRSLARWPIEARHFCAGPLARGRPDLRRAVEVAPRSVRELSIEDGRRAVSLARDAMVTRSRDLDAFMHGDERDVRWIDCGDGLSFLCIGVRPTRRLLLESVYAFLTLKNGVPIGYVLCSALMGSSEIAYNVFDTYRGAEAAAVYGRVLAMVRALFGTDTFTIYPYQLGHENEEGLKSGAWWFYQKLGFRPREPRVLARMHSELTRMAKDPAHRSSRATLKRLAAHNVYFELGERRDDVIGVYPLYKVGEAITRLLASRFGADREGATRMLSAEVQALLGSPPWSDLDAEERMACERWAPLVACLPDVARWSPRERLDLFEVMRAKGSRRESDFVARFDAHARLRRALRDFVAVPARQAQSRR